MKPLIIGVGLVAVVGAGWYFLQRDDESGSAAAVASSDAPARQRSAESAPAARGGGRFEPRRDGTLEQRVARLEDEVASLRRQLAMRGRVALSGSDADVEDIVEDPALDQQVRSIVEDERELERERRDERRAERFAEFRAEALDELSKVAGLSDKQRESIDELWSTESEQMIPIIGAARSGERSFREVRDEIEGIRKETDDAARAMLSEAQLEHYDELRPRGPGGRGRGDRGRGGNRPPPP